VTCNLYAKHTKHQATTFTHQMTTKSVRFTTPCKHGTINKSFVTPCSLSKLKIGAHIFFGYLWTLGIPDGYQNGYSGIC